PGEARWNGRPRGEHQDRAPRSPVALSRRARAGQVPGLAGRSGHGEACADGRVVISGDTARWRSARDGRHMMTALLLLACAYGVGSLSFGLWLARTQGVDLRAAGSRNVGATNVLRTVGRLFALVVLVLDAGKGALAVGVARVVTDDAWLITGCAVAVVVGHMWPIWAGF